MPRKKKPSAEAAVRDIRRKTRRRFSAEEKIRIVLEGLRGEQSGVTLRSARGSSGLDGTPCAHEARALRQAGLSGVLIVR